MSLRVCKQGEKSDGAVCRYGACNSFPRPTRKSVISALELYFSSILWFYSCCCCRCCTVLHVTLCWKSDPSSAPRSLRFLPKLFCSLFQSRGLKREAVAEHRLLKSSEVFAYKYKTDLTGTIVIKEKVEIKSHIGRDGEVQSGLEQNRTEKTRHGRIVVELFLSRGTCLFCIWVKGSRDKHETWPREWSHVCNTIQLQISLSSLQ